MKAEGPGFPAIRSIDHVFHSSQRAKRWGAGRPPIGGPRLWGSSSALDVAPTQFTGSLDSPNRETGPPMSARGMGGQGEAIAMKKLEDGSSKKLGCGGNPPARVRRSKAGRPTRSQPSDEEEDGWRPLSPCRHHCQGADLQDSRRARARRRARRASGCSHV
jgi:hypothetical protein